MPSKVELPVSPAVPPINSEVDGLDDDETRPLGTSSEEPRDDTDVVEPVAEPAVSTLMMVFIMIGDVVGFGVLSLPMAYVRLGWLPALAVNVATYLVTTYTGLLIFTAHNANREVRSYPKLFKKILGKHAQIYASVCVYASLFLYIAGSMLVQADSIQQFSSSIGITKAAVLAITFSFVVLQARTMPNVGLMSVAANVTVLIALGFAAALLHVMVTSDSVAYPPGHRALVGNSFVEALVGVMAFVYSYSGHVIFFELISEMREPNEFPKALWLSQTAVFLLYTLIGCYVYARVGDAAWLRSPFTLSLRPGVVRDVVQVCIIAHTALGVSVNGIIFVRAIQNRLEPRLRVRFQSREAGLSVGLEDQSWRQAVPSVEPPTSKAPSAVLWWAFWSLLTILAVFAVDIVVPFFDNIISLSAALVSSQANVTWPALFDVLLFWRYQFGEPRRTGRILINVVLVAIGVFLLAAGLAANFVDLENEEMDPN